MVTYSLDRGKNLTSLPPNTHGTTTCVNFAIDCESKYLEVNDKYHNKPVCQGDRSIIDVAIEKGYRDKTLESINVVQKYLNLMHLSDLVQCDGRTLSKYLLEMSGRADTKVIFPKEKLTRSDKSL